MKTSSRLVRVSASLPLTSFLISGSSGLGGVTGTTFESLVKPGLFGRSALYEAVFGTFTDLSSVM